jgi:hypothetical protein
LTDYDYFLAEVEYNRGMRNWTIIEEELLSQQGKPIDDHWKEMREEERAERLLSIIDARTIKLLDILAKIASGISNNPIKALIYLIVGWVAINVLTNFITFMGYQTWVIIIMPYLKSLGLGVQ